MGKTGHSPKYCGKIPLKIEFLAFFFSKNVIYIKLSFIFAFRLFEQNEQIISVADQKRGIYSGKIVFNDFSNTLEHF